MSISLMTRVWDETRFAGNDLLVLLCIADHADDNGVCWPSQKRIALRSRCSERTVKRIIARLKSEGFLEVTQRWSSKRPESNTYKMILPNQNMGDKLAPIIGDTARKGGGQTKRSMGDTAMAHQASGESSIESSLRKVAEIARKRREQEAKKDIPFPS